MTAIKSITILLSSIYLVNGFLGMRFGRQFLERRFKFTFSESDLSSIATKWIDQPLDHFNGDNDTVWKMKYFERLDFFKAGGPIYLYINGEAPADNTALMTGTVYDLAQETNGAMFVSEHRYYGDSKPFNELNAETLKYLSSEQALADLAKLLKELKKKPEFTESKVVVVGGSYAGNLAAWMRLKYTDLVDAALASSAPVLAKKDFYDYLEKVNDDFTKYGTPGCIDKISEIFSRYAKLFQTSDGIAQLKEEENICDETDFTKPENQQEFFVSKVITYMGAAQYGSPNTIKEICNNLTSGYIFPVNEYNIGFIEIKYSDNNCYDFNFESATKSILSDAQYTCWIYQTCTEFGYFSTTDSDRQPFTRSIPPEYYYKQCSLLFGSDFDENRVDQGVSKTNSLYQGLTPDVTKVVFTNGDLDPYSTLGILEDLSKDAPAKVISDTSHCSDLFSDPSGDPEDLKEARQYVKNMIKMWIGAGEFKV